MNNISDLRVSSNNNTKRHSSFLSTSSSFKKKKVLLHNGFSPLNNMNKIKNNKKIENFPICISIFANNFSLNENEINTNSNPKQKINLKISNVNKKMKDHKLEKKIISRNPNSFLLSSLSSRQINSNTNIKSFFQNNYKIASKINEVKPLIHKVNYSPLYKCSRLDFLPKNNKGNITNTTLDQDLSDSKNPKNISYEKNIIKKKFIASSPHNSGIYQKNKIKKLLEGVNKIDAYNKKNKSNISIICVNKNNNNIIKEFNKLINEAMLKSNNKLYSINNYNDNINCNDNNINKINNDNIDNNDNNDNNDNIDNNNNNDNNDNNGNNDSNIDENIIVNNNENLINNNDVIINRKNKDILNNNMNIIDKKFRDKEINIINNNNKSIINNQNKKDINILQKEKYNILKKETKILKKSQKKVDKYIPILNLSEYKESKKNKNNINEDKKRPINIDIQKNKNDLENNKKNFYLLISNKQSNIIYDKNKFLNKINQKSVNNSINMKIFQQKSKILIYNKKKVNYILNYESNKLKENNNFLTIKTFSWEDYENNYKDNIKKNYNKYNKYFRQKLQSKHEKLLFNCNIRITLRNHIINSYEFQKIPSIIKGAKNYMKLIPKTSQKLNKFRFKSYKDVLKIYSKYVTSWDFDIFNIITMHNIIIKSFHYNVEDKNCNQINVKNDVNKNYMKKISNALKYKSIGSKIILNALNKKNLLKPKRFGDNISFKRNLLKRSTSAILAFKKKLNIQNSQKLSDLNINMNNYSLLNKRHFFQNPKEIRSIKKSTDIDGLNDIDEIDGLNDIDEIYLELIRLIIEGKSNSFISFYKKNKDLIDINQELFGGNSLLILSTREGNYLISKFLCEHGSEVNNQNHNGNTALHYAIGKHYYNIADILTKYGAREDIKNNNKLTAWECLEDNIHFKY